MYIYTYIYGKCCLEVAVPVSFGVLVTGYLTLILGSGRGWLEAPTKARPVIVIRNGECVPLCVFSSFVLFLGVEH